MTPSYIHEDEREKKKISKFSILNCVIGIPTIAFLILLLAKGLLVNYSAIVYSAIGLLGLGIVYSIYKMIRR
ncbi:MAG: hypothetical protein E3J43_03950 [Candidatus Heimdallarchaeota archaeon]|nr:MAG: hypothetical protein E3J43_03950 [Candidatus Heimdallarchaeota archaeon]